MKLYTWNIPEISHFPIYDRYMSGIFHTYDTIHISDAAERGAWAAESRQRGGQGGKAQHELAVVIGQANEAADLCARSGLSPLSDCCNLAGVDGDAVLGDDMTEEPD